MEKTLEERVAALEDQNEIDAIVNKYAYTLDGKDLKGLMSIFDENILLKYPQQDLELIGKRDVSNFFSEVFENNKELRHKIVNREITVLGNNAKLRAYLMASLVFHDGRERHQEGRYYATLRKIMGEWKIREWTIDLTVQIGAIPEYKSLLGKA